MSIDTGPSTTNIETLFKVEPPLTELKDGFGYMGVILSDKTTGNLQCHLCGGYYAFLGTHVFTKHGIKSKEYRIKFQLPLTFPLCNKIISQKIRENSLKKDWKKVLFNQGKVKPSKKYDNNASYARNNASFHNKSGLCELQMQKRYLLVSDLVERDPSEDDLEVHDKKLLWAIKNRYTNLNNFKDKYGFKKYVFTKKGDKVLRLKQNPDAYKIFNNLKKSEREGIIKTYGSIHRACAYIGK